ncbi:MULTISPECIES: ATP-dependent zinc protease [unclassified Endozoicomonas]|uniref:ATP-dependent zinc protease family protein n=1 Tax=unclassified Endozoicomonas TaxID=2644528 RepID=UPI003BB7842E
MLFSTRFSGLTFCAILALAFIPSALVTAAPPPYQHPCQAGDRYLFGLQERVDQIDEFSTRINALIDSGSTLSSMDARDIKIRKHTNGSLWVHFKVPTTSDKRKLVKMTKPLKRFARVQTHHGTPQKRPVIEATIRLGPVETRTDFSLTSRSRFRNQILLGTNTLKNLAIIDISREFLLKNNCQQVSRYP